jgi:hypothetical protein
MKQTNHKEFLPLDWNRKEIVEKVLWKELLTTLQWVQWKTQDEERRKTLQLLLRFYARWVMHFRKWRKDQFPDNEWNDIEYPEFQESLSDQQKALLEKMSILTFCIDELRTLYMQYPELARWEAINPGVWETINFDRTPQYLFTYWEIKEIGLSREMYRTLTQLLEEGKFQHKIEYSKYCLSNWYLLNYSDTLERIYPYLMLRWQFRGLWGMQEYDSVATWSALGEVYTLPQCSEYNRNDPPIVEKNPDISIFVKEKWVLNSIDRDINEIQKWVKKYEEKNPEQLWLFIEAQDYKRKDNYEIWAPIRRLVAQATYAPTDTITPEIINPLVEKCYFYRALCAKKRCEQVAQKTWYGPNNWFNDGNILFVCEYLHRYGEAPEHWITQARVDDYLNTYVYVARGEKE